MTRRRRRDRSWWPGVAATVVVVEAVVWHRFGWWSVGVQAGALLIAAVIAGGWRIRRPAPSPLAAEPTSLYEIVCADGHRYYGIAVARGVQRRWREHVGTKPWAAGIVSWRIVATYPDRAAALAAEAATIRAAARAGVRLHNQVHNPARLSRG